MQSTQLNIFDLNTIMSACLHVFIDKQNMIITEPNRLRPSTVWCARDEQIFDMLDHFAELQHQLDTAFWPHFQPTASRKHLFIRGHAKKCPPFYRPNVELKERDFLELVLITVAMTKY